jgi:hypothetical protein
LPLAANHGRRRGPGIRANIRAHRDIRLEYRSGTVADGRAGSDRSTPREVRRRWPVCVRRIDGHD